MLFRSLAAALAAAAALAYGLAWAQTPQPADDAQNLHQKIHDDLVSRGFTDVRVVPQSFLISAKDKNGQAIVMLVGPNSMTVLSAPQSGDPSTAESKDGKDKLIQQ
jgi:hypothetical protein